VLNTEHPCSALCLFLSVLNTNDLVNTTILLNADSTENNESVLNVKSVQNTKSILNANSVLNNFTHRFTDRDDVKSYDIYGVTVGEVEVDLLTGQHQVSCVCVVMCWGGLCCYVMGRALLLCVEVGFIVMCWGGLYCYVLRRTLLSCFESDLMIGWNQVSPLWIGMG